SKKIRNNQELFNKLQASLDLLKTDKGYAKGLTSQNTISDKIMDSPSAASLLAVSCIFAERLAGNKVWDGKENTYGDRAKSLIDTAWGRMKKNSLTGGLNLPFQVENIPDKKIVIDTADLNPYVYRLFAEHDKEHDWPEVVKSCYGLLDRAENLAYLPDRLIYDPAGGKIEPFQQVLDPNDYESQMYRYKYRTDEGLSLLGRGLAMAAIEFNDKDAERLCQNLANNINLKSPEQSGIYDLQADGHIKSIRSLSELLLVGWAAKNTQLVNQILPEIKKQTGTDYFAVPGANVPPDFSKRDFGLQAGSLMNLMGVMGYWPSLTDNDKAERAVKIPDDFFRETDSFYKPTLPAANQTDIAKLKISAFQKYLRANNRQDIDTFLNYEKNSAELLPKIGEAERSFAQRLEYLNKLINPLAVVIQAGERTAFGQEPLHLSPADVEQLSQILLGIIKQKPLDVDIAIDALAMLVKLHKNFLNDNELQVKIGKLTADHFVITKELVAELSAKLKVAPEEMKNILDFYEEKYKRDEVAFFMKFLDLPVQRKTFQENQAVQALWLDYKNDLDLGDSHLLEDRKQAVTRMLLVYDKVKALDLPTEQGKKDIELFLLMVRNSLAEIYLSLDDQKSAEKYLAQNIKSGFVQGDRSRNSEVMKSEMSLGRIQAKIGNFSKYFEQSGKVLHKSDPKYDSLWNDVQSRDIPVYNQEMILTEAECLVRQNRFAEAEHGLNRLLIDETLLKIELTPENVEKLKKYCLDHNDPQTKIPRFSYEESQGLLIKGAIRTEEKDELLRLFPGQKALIEQTVEKIKDRSGYNLRNWYEVDYPEAQEALAKLEDQSPTILENSNLGLLLRTLNTKLKIQTIKQTDQNYDAFLQQIDNGDPDVKILLDHWRLAMKMLKIEDRTELVMKRADLAKQYKHYDKAFALYKESIGLPAAQTLALANIDKLIAGSFARNIGDLKEVYPRALTNGETDLDKKSFEVKLQTVYSWLSLAEISRKEKQYALADRILHQTLSELQKLKIEDKYYLLQREKAKVQEMLRLELFKTQLDQGNFQQVNSYQVALQPQTEEEKLFLANIKFEAMCELAFTYLSLEEFASAEKVFKKILATTPDATKITDRDNGDTAQEKISVQLGLAYCAISKVEDVPEALPYIKEAEHRRQVAAELYAQAKGLYKPFEQNMMEMQLKTLDGTVLGAKEAEEITNDHIPPTQVLGSDLAFNDVEQQVRAALASGNGDKYQLEKMLVNLDKARAGNMVIKFYKGMRRANLREEFERVWPFIAKATKKKQKLMQLSYLTMYASKVDGSKLPEVEKLLKELSPGEKKLFKERDKLALKSAYVKIGQTAKAAGISIDPAQLPKADQKLELGLINKRLDTYTGEKASFPKALKDLLALAPTISQAKDQTAIALYFTQLISLYNDVDPEVKNAIVNTILQQSGRGGADATYAVEAKRSWAVIEQTAEGKKLAQTLKKLIKDSGIAHNPKFLNRTQGKARRE
ncbi:MAG: hypothetical protein WC838_05215, partial [Candidatus Margulisiibacteriota bacterium]